MKEIIIVLAGAYTLYAVWMYFERSRKFYENMIGRMDKLIEVLGKKDDPTS